MKKLLIVVVVALASAFSAEAGEKMEVQTSVGIRAGQCRSTTQLETTSRDSKAIGLDLDLLRHRKYVTWGVGLRKRSADSSAGKLEYLGVGILVGYYSNKNKEKLFGWHSMLGVGSGSLTGIGNGYSGIAQALKIHSDWGIGLDWRVRVYKSENPLKRPSAVTLSLDYRRDTFGTLVKRFNPATNREVGVPLRSNGQMIALGANYFW